MLTLVAVTSGVLGGVINGVLSSPSPLVVVVIQGPVGVAVLGGEGVVLIRPGACVRVGVGLRFEPDLDPEPELVDERSWDLASDGELEAAVRGDRTLLLLLEGVIGVNTSPGADWDRVVAGGAVSFEVERAPSRVRSTAEATNAGAALRVMVFCLLGPPALNGPELEARPELGETGMLVLLGVGEDEEVLTESERRVLIRTGEGSGAVGRINLLLPCWGRL